MRCGFGASSNLCINRGANVAVMQRICKPSVTWACVSCSEEEGKKEKGKKKKEKKEEEEEEKKT